MAERWFTPDTARQALPEVQPVAETLCRLYRRLEQRRPACIQPEQPVEPGYFVLVARLHAALAAIRRRGVRVQDARRGSLGFPARRAGRAVLLCWQVGEERLGYWRDPGFDVAGRHPVDDDGPWEAA